MFSNILLLHLDDNFYSAWPGRRCISLMGGTVASVTMLLFRPSFLQVANLT